MSSIAKQQRLLNAFFSNEEALRKNIDAYVAASDIHDANPCRETKRPCNQLKHQHFQKLHRRDASWLRLLALFASKGQLT